MTQEALKLAFEKVTSIPDAWTNSALMQARSGFIQGWEASLSQMAQRTWVGLTDEEVQDAGRYSYCRGGTSESLYYIMWNSQPSASVGWCREELISFAQAVEAKYWEKNQ